MQWRWSARFRGGLDERNASWAYQEQVLSPAEVTGDGALQERPRIALSAPHRGGLVLEYPLVKRGTLTARISLAPGYLGRTLRRRASLPPNTSARVPTPSTRRCSGP
jgi:hypothetical protein